MTVSSAFREAYRAQVPANVAVRLALVSPLLRPEDNFKRIHILGGEIA